jgi:hypothetical protein
MSSDVDRAQRWRALAEEARAVAERMTDLEGRRIMLSIAERYERLARRADAQRGKPE